MNAIVSIQSDAVDDVSKEFMGNLTPFIEFFNQKIESLSNSIISADSLYQLLVILCGLGLASFLRGPIHKLVNEYWPSVNNRKPFLSNLLRSINQFLMALVWVLTLWVAIPIFNELHINNDMLRIVASLLQAWIVINLFSTVVHDPVWSRTFAAIAWLIAALYILRLLNPTIEILEGVGINFGQTRLSLYAMIKGVVLLILLIWLATQISKFVQARIHTSTNMTPSIRSLVSQLVRLGSLFLAAVIALNAIGVDLTALAVFSGAVGVGVGFGLQAIFSNLMSGAIMLMEGSVSVGDFVELESGVTGEVKEINTRATLITTNDKVDVLVPNSQFINGTVTNWTLRDKHRRTRIPFGVAYGTDKDLVKKAVLEAAATLNHELQGKHARPADVWLVGFGESSLDFELVLWLHPDAVKRPLAVLAEYNWAIETALRKYNIEIPFPQRDLHIRSGLALSSGERT